MVELGLYKMQLKPYSSNFTTNSLIEAADVQVSHRQPRTFSSPSLITLLIAASLLAKATAKSQYGAYVGYPPWVPYKPVAYYSPYYQNYYPGHHHHPTDNPHHHHHHQLHAPPVNQQQIVNIHERPRPHGGGGGEGGSGTENFEDINEQNHQHIITTIQRPMDSFAEEMLASNRIVSIALPDANFTNENFTKSGEGSGLQSLEASSLEALPFQETPQVEKSLESSGEIYIGDTIGIAPLQQTPIENAALPETPIDVTPLDVSAVDASPLDVSMDASNDDRTSNVKTTDIKSASKTAKPYDSHTLDPNPSAANTNIFNTKPIVLKLLESKPIRVTHPKNDSNLRPNMDKYNFKGKKNGLKQNNPAKNDNSNEDISANGKEISANRKEIIEKEVAETNVNYRRVRPDVAYLKNLPRRTTSKPTRRYGSDSSRRRGSGTKRGQKRPFATTFPSYFDDYEEFNPTTQRPRNRRRTTPRRTHSKRRPTSNSYIYDEYDYENSLESTTRINNRGPNRNKRRPVKTNNRRRPVEDSTDSQYYSMEDDDAYKDHDDYSGYDDIDLLPRQGTTTSSTTETTTSETTTQSSSTTTTTETTSTSTTPTPATGPSGSPATSGTPKPTSPGEHNNTGGYGYGPANGNDNISITYGPPGNHGGGGYANYDYNNGPSGAGYGPSQGNENISITYGPPTLQQRLDYVAPLLDAWYSQYSAKNAVVRRIQELLHQNTQQQPQAENYPNYNDNAY